MPKLLEMVAKTDDVPAGVGEGLARVGALFESHLESDVAFVSDLCRHIERYRGKMLRPSLTLLCGLDAAGDSDATVSDAHVTIGAVIELVHMATLVHDDVLDDAEVRRGGETVNRLHGNRTAILLGDYLIASAFHLCSSLDDQSVALRIGAVTRRVCEGELLQLQNRGNLDVTPEAYFDIIERKTASLIGAACELGAAASGASAEAQARYRRYGVAVGCAYQIQDDLLDLLGEEGEVGKSVNRDLEAGTLTLPLVHLLRHAGGAAREAALEADRATLRRLATEAGSIEHASGEARRLVEEAKAALPAGPLSGLLGRLADASVSRKY